MDAEAMDMKSPQPSAAAPRQGSAAARQGRTDARQGSADGTRQGRTAEPRAGRTGESRAARAAEPRTDRSGETRAAIMVAAERLIAERGLASVSNRQIGEAAGQGNVTVVSYHFGTKASLIRAIMERHSESTDGIRQRMLERIGDSTRLRDWVACLVGPMAEHLGTLDTPSWHARFSLQVMADPSLRALFTDDSVCTEPVLRTLEGLGRCLAGMPPEVRAQRRDMARHLTLGICADREHALALGTAPPNFSWHDTAVALTDAVTGLYSAPVTHTERT